MTKRTKQIRKVTRGDVVTITETETTTETDAPDVMPRPADVPAHRPLPVWAYIGACLIGIILAPIIAAIVHPAPVTLPAYTPRAVVAR